MARQLKLGELNRNTVVTLVSVGVSQRQAAMHVGCDASTITKLATRDEAFAEQLRDARRRAQQEPLELIKKHADRSWRAAAWLLEKSHPHLYGKQAGKVSEQALEEQRIELVQILADEIGDAQLLDRIIDRLHQLDEAGQREPAVKAPCQSDEAKVVVEESAGDALDTVVVAPRVEPAPESSSLPRWPTVKRRPAKSMVLTAAELDVLYPIYNPLAHGSHRSKLTLHRSIAGPYALPPAGGTALAKFNITPEISAESVELFHCERGNVLGTAANSNRTLRGCERTLHHAGA